MSKNLEELTIEEMLQMKDDLNAAYEVLIEKQNAWLKQVHDLRKEMMCRSLDLEIMQEQAKADRQADFDHLYEAKNQIH